MLWSGTSPLSVVRQSMWGFLLFAGAAWLAIGWSVLRLEPADLARVAGPVVLFGALTEAVRALAGTRTWWLNAGLAALFTLTGAILLAGVSTPAALLGWYLIVRGACDVAVAMMTRETDRIWGLLLVAGVLQAALGFYAAAPPARTTETVILIIGGLGLLRGTADLVAALRLREVSAFRAEILDLPPERAAGVAGYTAGLTDFEAAPARSTPKHRAPTRSSLPSAADSAQPSATGQGQSSAAQSAAAGSSSAQSSAAQSAAAQSAAARSSSAGQAQPGAAGQSSAVGEAQSGPGGESFHDEVLRTTADLDAILALAGVSGAAAGAAAHHEEIEPVPDSPEGMELPPGTGVSAATTDRTDAPRR